MDCFLSTPLWCPGDVQQFGVIDRSQPTLNPWWPGLHVRLSLSHQCACRKLLERQVEELRQQLRRSRETEASLAKRHMELQAKALHVLEDERKTDSREVSCSPESPHHPRWCCVGG